CLVINLLYLHSVRAFLSSSLFFFFTRTAPSVIYTLSLHDALPISGLSLDRRVGRRKVGPVEQRNPEGFEARALEVDHLLESARLDRKSTRLNSSHSQISYAVFCLKKKKKKKK